MRKREKRGSSKVEVKDVRAWLSAPVSQLTTALLGDLNGSAADRTLSNSPWLDLTLFHGEMTTRDPLG